MVDWALTLDEQHHVVGMREAIANLGQARYGRSVVRGSDIDHRVLFDRCVSYLATVALLQVTSATGVIRIGTLHGPG